MTTQFTTFSGIGGWETGFKRVFDDLEIVGYSEIDKYAIQAYEQTHPSWVEIGTKYSDSWGEYKASCQRVKKITPKNYGDITKINPEELPNFDIYCNSPPCQAFSVAGKNQGKDDEKGRGRLFENSINIMKVKQPKIAIYENVKGLTFKKHKEYFEYILSLMEGAGYNVTWKILNTKEHGIPQNRERIFIVCIRKDINETFHFPEKEELKIFVKDILEKNVDDKYKISEKALKLIMERLNTSYESKFNPDISNTLRTNYGNSFANETYILGNTNSSGKGMNGNVYGGEVFSTITTNKGEGVKIFQRKRGTNKGGIKDGKVSPTLSKSSWENNNYIMTVGNYSKSNHNASRVIDPAGVSPTVKENHGTVTAIIEENKIIKTQYGKHQQDCFYDSKGIMASIPAGTHGSTPHLTKVLLPNFRIRKLTPKECFRLQGYKDNEYSTEGLSNSQKYKIAGNGLSINVIEKLAKEVKRILENDK